MGKSIETNSIYMPTWKSYQNTAIVLGVGLSILVVFIIILSDFIRPRLSTILKFESASRIYKAMLIIVILTVIGIYYALYNREVYVLGINGFPIYFWSLSFYILLTLLSKF